MRNTVYKLLLIVALAALVVQLWAADNILGLWKTVDDKTGKPRSYVMIYMYQGKVYGRIVALISETTGELEDSLEIKKFKADKYVGDPYSCGLDFLYELVDKGKEWKGSITDPKDGSIYDCSIKRDGDKLIVRGSLRGTGGLLGRNQTWYKADPSELPFKLPDSSTFIPSIPVPKKK